MKHIKNNYLMRVITDLKTLAIENKVPFWKKVATELERPTNTKREVNIFKLEKYAKEGDLVLVPGKVLGTGDLTKKLTIVALSLSESAKDKILAAKGEILTIEQLMEKNPKASKVKLMG